MNKKQLFKLLADDYKTPSVYAIINGRRKPNPENRYRYEKEYGIPFTAWNDISLYLNDGISSNKQSTPHIQVSSKSEVIDEEAK